ncbi:MAG: dienelactone hydrolase family protein [Flammeovirgaceae bacterium]|nr:MAG: dienelactone hydrolase family protein [Flammeovirgaceae bacterium]
MAHGAGAGMRHPFMQRVAEELAGHRIATIRYNFPFTENNKKRPDSPAVAMATVKAAINFASVQYPGIPLFAGGKSFGGRMTSQFIAQHGAANVKGIVFFGFPLHPAGKPGVERANHLQQLAVPMLFLQGTRDPLADVNLITKVCSDLKTATLITFEQADHSFKVSKHDLLPVLARHTVKWMKMVES